MKNQRTIKALEDLVKSEYTTATALDAALADAEDSRLRRNYRRWRDSHIKQAEALNGRIKALGGHATHYEFREGNIYPIFWNLMKGSHDYKALSGVRIMAGRGLKQYVGHLNAIDDLESLNLLRHNLEAKQDEMQWYDDQVLAQHNLERQADLEKTREVAKKLEQKAKGKQASKRGAASPLAALAVAGAIGAAAFLITRGNDAQDDESIDDYTYERSGEPPRLEVDLEA